MKTKCDVVHPYLAAHPGGFYLLETREVDGAMNRLELALPGVRFFYAMKANSHPCVLRRVMAAGWGFDAASAHEIDTLISLGVPGERIVAANPVKDTATIARLWERGIGATVVDSVEEVHKLARARPGKGQLGVLVRIALDGEHSWRLSRKFGCQPEGIAAIVAAIAAPGLQLMGLHFHVGTQCREPELFGRALEKAAWLARNSMTFPRHLSPVIDMGGGFPVNSSAWQDYDEDAFLGQVAQSVARVQSQGFAVWAEPGRYVCGRAGTLVVAVIGKVKRRSGWWLHLDNGIYGSFLTSLADGQRYRFLACGHPATSNLVSYTLCGPTCDGVDVIQEEVWLPAGLVEGDRLVVPDIGAYTLETTTGFNGFSGPPVIPVENS